MQLYIQHVEAMVGFNTFGCEDLQTQLLRGDPKTNKPYDCIVLFFPFGSPGVRLSDKGKES